jgi:hypothetical protein
VITDEAYLSSELLVYGDNTKKRNTIYIIPKIKQFYNRDPINKILIYPRIYQNQTKTTRRHVNPSVSTLFVWVFFSRFIQSWHPPINLSK